MRTTLLGPLAALLVLASGCNTPELWPSSVEGVAPQLGKADSTDQADRACQIVLRSVGRELGGDDYQTRCEGGVCNYLWNGIVEVAEGLPGSVRVLYRLADTAKWWQVEGEPADAAQPGFVRYRFSISQHLFGPSTEGAAIELMPYLARPDGSRLFDHNRRPGDLDNYLLDPASSFSVGEDNACAPVAGRISFLQSFENVLFGSLRQGGYLVIDYQLERLPECRGTHNGHPAWDIVAHARFLPGGQRLEASVRSLQSAQGVPTNVGVPKEVRFKIPRDATSVELWFHNYTGAGSSCSTWDSSYGTNYLYEIWPPASDPRCKNLEEWQTVNSDMPYRTAPTCLRYTVDEQRSSESCELYLSGIGDGFMGHYGIPNNWVEAYLTVGPQPGKLLGVGQLTRYSDPATKATGERYTMGRRVSEDTWQTGFIYLYPGLMGAGGYRYEVQELAFFIDVERPQGGVARLWQGRNGANYTWSDAFSLPTVEQWIPYGRIKYAAEGSSIFDVKHACGK